MRGGRREDISGTRIHEVERAGEFVVRAESGVFRAPVLVVATGGLSIPKMGASGFGYGVARKFGLKIRQTRPALVPFVLGVTDRNQYCDLAGVSAEVAVSIDDQVFRDKMLFTHRGLSGPAILQISSYWNAGEPIRIDLAPGRDIAAAIGEGPAKNKTGGGRAARVPGIPSASSCHALAGVARACRMEQSGIGGTGPANARMGSRPRKDRGLRKSRGHGRRRGYRRALEQDDGEPEGAGTVFYRRSCGRHRPPGRP